MRLEINRTVFFSLLLNIILMGLLLYIWFKPSEYQEKLKSVKDNNKIIENEVNQIQKQNNNIHKINKEDYQFRIDKTRIDWSVK